MPDNSDKNDKNQNQTQKQGNQGQQGNQGNIDRDKGQDFGGGRQVQSDKGNVGGKQGSTNIEDNDVSPVSNDNDSITQRNPRQGDTGQQGQNKMGNQGSDRDRK